MRWIKKKYPHIKWVVSFADGTQCGDGTIYRASGFVLTGISESKSLWKMQDGTVVHEFAFRIGSTGGGIIKKKYGYKEGENRRTFLKENARLMKGFQLRYIYFIDQACKSLLTVSIIPFSRIDEIGAGMYKGKPKRAESIENDAHNIPVMTGRCDSDLGAPLKDNT